MPNPGSTGCWVGPGPQAPRSPKQGPCVKSGSRLPVTLPAAPCPAAVVHANGRKSPRVATGESLAGGSGPFHTDFQGGLYQCGGADGEAGDGTGRCTGGGGAATAGTESGGAGDDPDGSSASPRSSTSDSELESRNLPTPSPRCSDERAGGNCGEAAKAKNTGRRPAGATTGDGQWRNASVASQPPQSSSCCIYNYWFP